MFNLNLVFLLKAFCNEQGGGELLSMECYTSTFLHLLSLTLTHIMCYIQDKLIWFCDSTYKIFSIRTYTPIPQSISLLHSILVTLATIGLISCELNECTYMYISALY